MSSGPFRGLTPDDEPEAVSSYWLRVGNREIQLHEGETVVGRGDGCAIVVSESLVSRRHARVLLDRGRPYIEDLGSANGTFVNQARLHGRALLFPGDHVFVGTCEIEVVRRIEEDRPTMPTEVPEQRLTPDSGVGAYGARQSAAPSSRRRRSGRPVDTTEQLDGLEYLGHLADKMFTMGRVDAALKILSTQLEDLLRGSRAGNLPSPRAIDTAGRYAVKLAHETLDGRWVDICVELHMLACRPLREETIQQLALLRAKAPVGDIALLTRYHERLRTNMSTLSAGERILCERVACLLPEAGR